MPPKTSPLLPRECFVTIGATASFKALIDAVNTTQFRKALVDLGYTRLTIQCGPELEYFKKSYESVKTEGLHVKGFDFNKKGLGQEMRGCKRIPERSEEGVVICHAGAGTILDAMRIDVPIIVVPNATLLDNHQAELAEELHRQGYVVHGELNNLPAALKESEAKSKARTAWPPNTSGLDPRGNGLVGIMDETLGFPPADPDELEQLKKRRDEVRREMELRDILD